MEYLQSIILGIVQGTTEFLPISSSAHLVLVPWLFGWDYNGLAFDTALHLGTAIAIVAFFLRDWVSIITQAIGCRSSLVSNNSDCRKQKNDNNKGAYPANLLWQILIASIPASIVGYFLSSYVESHLHSPILLAINLAVFGIILWLVDIWAQKKGIRHPQDYSVEGTQKKDETERLEAGNFSLNKITYLQSLYVGLAQTLALIPGVSRSGITITAARSLGLSRESAARFSFLLSTPAILGAFIFTARKTDWSTLPPAFWLAIAVTVIVGFLTIKYLLKYLQRGNFAIFTIYRIALAIVIVVLFLLR